MSVFAFAQKPLADKAVQARLALGAFLAPNGSLKARSGFIDQNEGIVTVIPASMQVQVSACRLFVDGAAAGQGVYPIINNAAQAVTLPDGGASTVVYVVGFRVKETLFDTTGLVDTTLEAWPKTSPPTGTLFPVREVTVPAGKNTANGGLIADNLGTDLRQYTSSLGGTTVVTGAAQRDAWVNAKVGQMIYRLDNDMIEVKTSSGWKVVWSPSPITPSWVTFNPNMSSGWDNGSWAYRIHGEGLVTLKAQFQRNGSTISANSEGNMAEQTITSSGIPAAIRPSENCYVGGKLGSLTSGSSGYIGMQINTDGSFKMGDAAPGLDIDNNLYCSLRVTYSR